ncbi:MAG: carbon-nitrogen hydrolase family protein [Planctomycetota bacterium]
MRIAIGQIGPVLLDRAATLARVVAAVHEAADAGAELIAFGETLVPGYPAWLSRTEGARFDSALQKTIHARYVREAVDLEAGDLEPVQSAARARSIAVVVGVAERPRDRGGHTLFCSAVTVAPDGSIASSHRKLVPTYEERLCWSHGDAHGLVAHRFLRPFTLGTLNCWENWMPLARAAMQAQGVDLHVAIWPGGDENTRDITRFVARESRSFVLSASSLLLAGDIPSDLPGRDAIIAGERTPADGVLHNGGSAIAGPDGQWVVEPVVGERRVIVADLAFDRVLEERQNFDPAGHYARPELLRLAVDRRRLAAEAEAEYP